MPKEIIITPHRVEALFPRVIYVTDNVCENILPELEQRSKEISKKYDTFRCEELNVDSTYETNKTIFVEKPFDILKDTIEYHCQNFLTELGITDIGSEVINMWVNISNKGDFNYPHTHSGAFLSGAFYIKANEGNFIKFFNDHYSMGNMYISREEKFFSSQYATIPCVTGRLMIWQSNFMHGNPPQSFDGEKIVVSFNTFICQRNNLIPTVDTFNLE